MMALFPTPWEQEHALSLPPNPQPNPQSTPQSPGQQRFQNPGKNSLSSIIGSYKSAVTKHAHRLKFNFEWQTEFHDHIIRDDKSFKYFRIYKKRTKLVGWPVFSRVETGHALSPQNQ